MFHSITSNDLKNLQAQLNAYEAEVNAEGKEIRSVTVSPQGYNLHAMIHVVPLASAAPAKAPRKKKGQESEETPPEGPASEPGDGEQDND